MGISFRLLFGSLPPTEPYLPAPKGSWWGLAFAIAFGLIQTIPVRGMLKLLMRLARVRGSGWSGWGAIVLREGYLVLAALAVLDGFHNVFMGTIPFVDPSLIGFEADHVAESGGPGVISLGLAALFLVVVRGGYKRRIGDPFIRETPRQSAVKHLLLVVGAVWLLYSFAIVMTGRPFLAAPLVNTRPAPLALGTLLFLWGLVLLGPVRFWAQRNQRLALVGQMAAVLLPAMPAPDRKAVMLRVMTGLAECPTSERVAYLSAMVDGLADAPPAVRTLMAELRAECLAELPSGLRRRLMATMDLAALGR